MKIVRLGLPSPREPPSPAAGEGGAHSRELARRDPFPPETATGPAPHVDAHPARGPRRRTGRRRLGRDAASAPSPRRYARRAFRVRGARRRPSPFCPPPAEPAAALAYGGTVPGPLLRREKGRGAETEVSQQAQRADDAYAFPACARPTPSPATAGSPGQGSRPARASTSTSPRRTRASISICRTPARPTPASRAAACSVRSWSTRPNASDVDEDVVVVLSDWSLDEKGQIKNDFADPALGARRRPAGERRVRGRRRRAAVAESARRARGCGCDSATPRPRG